MDPASEREKGGNRHEYVSDEFEFLWGIESKNMSMPVETAVRKKSARKKSFMVILSFHHVVDVFSRTPHLIVSHRVRKQSCT